MRRRRTQLRAAPASESAAVPVRRRHRPGAVAGRRAVVPGVRRSRAAGADSRSDGQQPGSADGGRRASKRRARGPAFAKSYPLPAGRRRRPGTACARRRTTAEKRRHDPPERGLRVSAVVGARSLRPHPPADEAATAVAARQRTGAPRRARHAGRGRRHILLPAARARPRSSTSRDSTLGLNDDTVTYFQNRLDGGVSNRLELDRIQANRALTAAAIPDIESRWPSSRTRFRCCSGARRARSRASRSASTKRCRRRFRPACRPRSSRDGPDVQESEQLLVAANADIGAAKALFFPTISLTGFLGGVSGDLTTFLGGDGAVWSVGAGLLQPVFQGGRLRRNLEAVRAQFDGAVAAYQRGRAQWLPGGRQLPGDHPEAG